jgi:hypothetical protein
VNEETRTAHAEILNCTARVRALGTTDDDRQGELLRLAQDPLLLRAFIERQAQESTSSCPRPSTGLGETPFFLSGVLARGFNAAPARRPSLREDDPRGGSPQDSLVPSLFVPTALDMASALSDPLPPEVPLHRGSRVRWMSALIAFILLCMSALVL